MKQGEHTLKRSLGAVNLITLGIGAVIGAGIFVLTGQAAALHAGPAVALSFVLAGITCAFAGLCYAEFASMIPIAGSAYTYGYATLGELVAWIIGWDLVLEYAFGASTVASGWSGYFNSLLQQFEIVLPPQLTATTGTVAGALPGMWMQSMSLPPGVSDAGLPHVTGVFNLIALCDCHGDYDDSGDRDQGVGELQLGDCVRQAERGGIFLVVGGFFLFHHPEVASAELASVHSAADANGNFGWGGIPTAAASDLLRLYRV